MKEHGLITFESTQFALQAETVFKDRDISFKTIPTPREVSHSCGLALLFDPEDVEIVKELVEEEKIDIDGLYKFLKEKHKARAEKILWFGGKL